MSPFLAVLVLVLPLALLLQRRELSYRQAFFDELPIMRYTENSLAARNGCRSNLRSLPSLIDRFDWHLGHDARNIPDRGLKGDPLTVFAAPNAVQRLVEIAERSFTAARNRTVVFAHRPETPLSEALGRTAEERHTTAVRLKKFFGNIFHDSKDIDIAGISLMPPTLGSCQVGTWDLRAAEAATAAAALDAAAKPRAVLAAWGAVYPGMERGDFLRKGPADGLSEARRRMLLEAMRSRRQARAWASTPEAIEAGVEVRSVPRHNFLVELSRYRFLLSPLGAEVARNSEVEALLTLTVPITHRGPYSGHDEMVRLGFPIVVVDRWEEVSRSRLLTWWATLAPRLEGFRKRCLTADGYWRYFTGQRTCA